VNTYGAALNAGRALFASDNMFNAWLVDRQLVGPNDHERAAAMWAAANPEGLCDGRER